VSPGNRTRIVAPRYSPAAALLVAAALLSGCASPGPPRAPSLQLPGSVRGLSVLRGGDAITVRFTLPDRTTDNLPIREGAVQASLCLAPEASPCTTLSGRQDVPLKVTPGTAAADRAIVWTVPLPPSDTTGKPQLLAVRVQLTNLGGKTAGWSEPAYTAAGVAPSPVEGLRAEETRSGILLRWQPVAGDSDEILLHREDLSPQGEKRTKQSEPIWLVSHAKPSGADADETMDTSAAEDVPYRYTALRRRIIQLDQQKIELRSSASPPVEIAWRNLFPPPAPTGLTAAPFRENGAFAVDLVWNPVDEVGLRGYVVIRRQEGISEQQLTPQPIPLPAYHDATAKPGIRYQYEVQAIGAKGVHSASAVVIVEPTTP